MLRSTKFSDVVKACPATVPRRRPLDTSLKKELSVVRRDLVNSIVSL